MSKRTKEELELQSDAEVAPLNCITCKKPMSMQACGIDGKGLSYCIPEGETLSDSAKDRLAEAQRNVRK